ncbi:Protein kinase domain [Dillenia turbinata]|uniref:non-specific serine/threonine protein kinase n=1 Tax=Dillenia turbinata TaxID=194707 RepID=A0AAN8W5G2_9MAGN
MDLGAMYPKLIILLFFQTIFAYSEDLSFTYNGFKSVNLALDGIARFTSNGLLELTNGTQQETAHAFYPKRVQLKNSSNSSVFCFSTTFVFAIITEMSAVSCPGMAFVISPKKGLPGASSAQYQDNGNSSNHVFAVELDAIQNDGLLNLSLISGKPIQVWVDYDCVATLVNVTLAPINVNETSIHPLSFQHDLSPTLYDTMYAGFSASTGAIGSSHYVLGWSFKVNGKAQDLDLSQLPELPQIGPKKISKFLTIGLPVICFSIVAIVITEIILVIRRKRKFAEVLEDWELDYGPQRFKYKDLYIATKGFKDKELLGTGGFGKVYRGILSSSKIEIAVKRISQESRQGVREFVAEIISLGRLRHRNLVALLGYCRRKGELLLVYDYMPNGSLDKYLHGQPEVTLNWRQRYQVIKGVASGLLYLHQGWEQTVIHRDIKASNVLLDSELNGKIGDFGLARLYDHGTDPQTTHVVGTLGYLAPEHTRTGKATTSTDVFAFGAFLLEVACGRRPIEPNKDNEDPILVDWVFSCLSQGRILEAADPNLGNEYVEEEMNLVLKLGLMCLHSDPSARPSMRQVVQYLEGDAALPDLFKLGICSTGLTFSHHEGFDDFALAYPSSLDIKSSGSSVLGSILSSGR